MRIERINVKNFRNLADIDLHLLPGTVLVGENRAGKSNLIHALRLVLDPDLSYFDRQLTREDFWDGLSDGTSDWDPMAAGEVIEVALEIADFQKNTLAITALNEALVRADPMRARLVYRFAPVAELEGSNRALSYKGHVLGGGEGEEHPIASDLRDYIALVFLPALRNVEADIKNWRRSPLRRLLNAATETEDNGALKTVHDAMVAANQAINGLESIRTLGDTIGSHMQEMVGDNQALETELAVAPDDPLRLIRGMQIYVDGDAHRSLGSSSLGSQNVLYLALIELGLGERQRTRDLAHVLMAIEGPEAHLHPHLQRLMFRRVLGSSEAWRTTLVTTHSPHIASVAHPRSLVVLRADGGRTRIAEAHRAHLTDEDWDDISRYLDVTRAELVFAQRVLFVEGFGEQALVPVMARTHGLDLDKIGVTVCAIHGTHFEAYAKFCDALEIPWAIVTDGDPGTTVDGPNRVQHLLDALGLTGTPSSHGVFVGATTLEYDIANVSENLTFVAEALLDLLKAPSAKIVSDWGAATPTYDGLMNMIDNAGGKGRFAQRLALRDVRPPSYVAAALDYLAQK